MRETYLVNLYDLQAVDQAEKKPKVQGYLTKITARREKRAARIFSS